MELQDSLVCPQEPVNGPYPEPDATNTQIPIPFPQDPFY